GAVGSILGAGVNGVFVAAGRWVADGALWLLDGVGALMSSTTSVDLGSGWFTVHESVMAALAAAVVIPLVCCAAIQAVYRQNASMLARSVLVNLPLALVFSGVAVELVRLGLAATDVLSASVLAGSGVNTHDLLEPISAVLVSASGSPTVPAFVVFAAGLLVAMATLVLWLELVVRSAAVAAAALFLPLALAGLAWPAVSHWCRRLADTLAALILSKLVVAAVLSLASGAVLGGLGLGAPAAGGFSAVVTGTALLALATIAPFTLLRLVPAIEAGAVMQLESARHRLGVAARAPLVAGSTALEIARSASPEGAASLAVGGADGSLAAGGTDTAASSWSVGGIPMLQGTPPGPEWEAVVQAARSMPNAPVRRAGDVALTTEESSDGQ
ncbi:MAG TPA: hypothetical protein VED63_10575, partial [Acidimicrobiales bacterium]|nr:hypothetical protein [Acidimicrobiales bacterium]